MTFHNSNNKEVLLSDDAFDKISEIAAQYNIKVKRDKVHEIYNGTSLLTVHYKDGGNLYIKESLKVQNSNISGILESILEGKDIRQIFI